MGPLLPIAALVAAVYGIKRHFDAKNAPAAPTGYPGDGATPPDPAAPPPDGSGQSAGGGGAAPGSPGYPMTSDPTYVPAATPAPLTLGQQAKALAALAQPRLQTTAQRAASPAAGTFAARAASIPSTYLGSGALPVPVAAPTPTMIRSLGGKTLTK